MLLKTAIKMLVALERAPEVKRYLRENGGACARHDGWCTCKPDELCNIALSEYLNMRPDVTWKEWNYLKKDLEEIGAVGTRLSQEFLDGKIPPYRPHRFIRLTKSVEEILSELVEKAENEMTESIETL